MTNQPLVLIAFGFVFALMGVGNLATGRLHPERPTARLSRGLGYVGVIIGILTLVFGLLMATGVLVPPQLPPGAPGGPPRPAAPAQPKP